MSCECKEPNSLVSLLEGVWSVLLWVELQNNLILTNTVILLYIHLFDLCWGERGRGHLDL